jgi:hypothetical protein
MKSVTILRNLKEFKYIPRTGTTATPTKTTGFRGLITM